MALVKMKVQISGSRNGQDWPPRGGLLEVPDDEAQTLVHTGIAEPAELEAAELEAGGGSGSGVESAALDTAPAKRRA